ncbi:AbrB/MazE/SpoVT family DNA-binding domain-containing protein [Pseudomonas sp. SIMBA_077]
MNRVPGTENQRWTVTCQDAADGTGDMIVPLPDDLLSQMGLVIGDTLTGEKQPDGSLTLTKTSQANHG